ncbi:Methyltransferase domain [Serratia rubidaea]|uniref:Methyltransferase domain n=1 Tax=Serratia rubidaea TaxID=61652 RepID=A0A4U9HA55_SERRU|nr:Methyltransferase domain [Serratia rubidaea]
MSGAGLQVRADAYQLPFAAKSVDACLLAHSLPYADDPHRMLREVDRILIDDGWLVISSFNPLSLLGWRSCAAAASAAAVRQPHVYPDAAAGLAEPAEL